MKIVIFTSTDIRHKFLANSLAKMADGALIISERKINKAKNPDKNEESPLITEHFKLRDEAEQKFFSGNDFFAGEVISLPYRDANLPSTYDIVKKFQPDLMFVFGSSIIKEPLLSLLPPGRFINLHLGLSPYYRGSGTNFWPFVNEELEFIGSTIIHIDAGIDTGDIITHVRPEIEIGDNAHTIGCKVIKSSVAMLIKIMEMAGGGKELPRIKQWQVPGAKYYRKKDFNEEILLKYYDNLKKGLVEKYLKEPKPKIKLIEF